MAKAKTAPLHVVEPEPEKLKIDIGCGKRTKEGFLGLDSIDFGQKYICDVRNQLPFADNSVDEIHSSHFIEHLTGAERVAFFNELHRVMKVGATAQFSCPHWSHACAYGDPTHQWPPMSEWMVFYLNRRWREGIQPDGSDANAPHSGYTCNFEYSFGGSWDQKLNGRNMEYISIVMNTQINAWRDLTFTLTKQE